MMNMQSRNQYLLELRTEYLKTKSKKQKGILLDEARKRTKLSRKHLVVKLRPKSNLDALPQARKKRKQHYDQPVVAALATCWKIFDNPCGQRLETSLKTEVSRLRKLGELKCSDLVAKKLKTISFRTIDEKLKHIKEVERLRQKYRPKIHPLLYQQVPVKVFDEQDRNGIGHLQTDLVEHCGASAAGEFINTNSNTDINFGWWEGEAAMGKSQEAINAALDIAWSRFPFEIAASHIDNGTEVLNQLMLRYCQKRNIDFSRSRPYKKNDNCLVEQKNKTHVKRFVGYLRYDTQEELNILNDLYRNELRLFKNFFQPAMKLISKERIKGHIKRKYDIPKTPYQRIMESRMILNVEKQELKKIYESLNPAGLKRGIDRKLDLLYKAYQAKKNQNLNVEISKIIKPRLVRKYIAQRETVSVR
jgi:hypothetical protein